MANTTNSSSGGIGFFGLLGIVFIILKLIGKIDWSWWYVLMPLYIPLVIALFIFLISATAAFIIFIKEVTKKQER